MTPRRGPIFVAGVDRSGLGLLGELLDAHPAIAISRRTNFWSFYHGRFGDLATPGNLERCVHEMLRYTRIQALQPDRDALLDALAVDGPPTYARLFATLQEQHLRRIGKSRWGDKSLDSEAHAGVILAAYPDAVMMHVIRDPRDRYASQASHRGRARGRVGSGIALWNWSVQHARRNLARHPGRYAVVRYEDLVTRPEATLRRVCTFVGEDFAPEMLDAPAQDGYASGGARRRAFTATSIGRFRRDLTPREVASIERAARRGMAEFGYAAAAARLPWPDRFAAAIDVPRNLWRMTAWRAKRAWLARRGGRPAPRRIAMT